MPLLTHTERLGTTLESTSTTRYRLLEVIGAGGMGIVFSAEREDDGYGVAVKIPRLELTADDARAARILAEGRLQRRLRHPNITALLDTGETHDGLPFLVFERLRGRSLAQAVKADGPLSAETTIRTLLPLAGALSVAHEQGIVHRDLSPANIFLHEDEATARLVPKLLDFGLARADDDPSLTCTGKALGTPDYMAPERLQEGRSPGPAADLWALSAVLHFCVTGRPPSRTGTALALPEAPALVVALTRGLREDPSHRYLGIQQWARSLLCAAVQDGIPLPAPSELHGLPAYSTWLAEALDSETASQAVEIPVRRRRHDSRVRGAALGVLALAAFGLASLHPTTTAPSAAPEASSSAAHAAATTAARARPTAAATAPAMPAEAPDPVSTDVETGGAEDAPARAHNRSPRPTHRASRPHENDPLPEAEPTPATQPPMLRADFGAAPSIRSKW